jgi:hypothetical protein
MTNGERAAPWSAYRTMYVLRPARGRAASQELGELWQLIGFLSGSRMCRKAPPVSAPWCVRRRSGLMDTAKLQILRANGAPVAVIELKYFMGIGLWTCPSAVFGATKGKWDAYVITPDLDLFDQDGDDVGRCWDVDGDWFGYPLSGHEGREGMFSVYGKGRLRDSYSNYNWKLIDV